MRWYFFFLALSFFINEKSLSQSKAVLPKPFATPISQELNPYYQLSEGLLDDLLKGDVVSIGQVDSPTDKEQQLMEFVAGVHPRNCTRAMRKLSRYEDYSKYIDFIKQSSYDEKNEKIHFTIDHVLLPFPMILEFKIARITKEGHYPFTFDHGFLKGLQGKVIVKEVGKFCLLGLKTDWRGPETKIPDSIFGTFIQTAAKLGLEHLIRVSLF